MSKKRVLFVCTHNSARSQMAEGILRHLYGNRYEVFSAGAYPTKVDPHAIGALKDVGIDISDSRSNSLVEFLGEKCKRFDFVVTVCDKAKETCPFFPGDGKRIHKSFQDPATVDDESERWDAFMRVRDEIEAWIRVEFGE